MWLGQVKRRAMKTIRGLEHFCDSRLRQLGLFSTEKRKLCGDFKAAFWYLNGADKRDGEGLFTRA